MTKIKFRYDILNKIILPRIKDILLELNNLKEMIDNLYIPEDFIYLNYFEDIKDKLNIWINNYKKLKFKIEKMNYYLESDINSLNNSHLKIFNNYDID